MTKLTTFRNQKGLVYTVTNMGGWVVLITTNRKVAEQVYQSLRNQTRDLWINIRESSTKIRRN